MFTITIDTGNPVFGDDPRIGLMRLLYNITDGIEVRNVKAGDTCPLFHRETGARIGQVEWSRRAPQEEVIS